MEAVSSFNVVLVPVTVAAKLQLLCFLWLSSFVWSPKLEVSRLRRKLYLLVLLQLLALASGTYSFWVIQHGVLHLQVSLALVTLAVAALLGEGAYGAYGQYGWRLNTKLWLIASALVFSLMLWLVAGLAAPITLY